MPCTQVWNILRHGRILCLLPSIVQKKGGPYSYVLQGGHYSSRRSRSGHLRQGWMHHKNLTYTCAQSSFLDLLTLTITTLTSLWLQELSSLSRSLLIYTLRSSFLKPRNPIRTIFFLATFPRPLEHLHLPCSHHVFLELPSRFPPASTVTMHTGSTHRLDFLLLGYQSNQHWLLPSKCTFLLENTTTPPPITSQISHSTYTMSDVHTTQYLPPLQSLDTHGKS